MELHKYVGCCIYNPSASPPESNRITDHLDDSFYNFMDTYGRGSRVRDEGADRPTPPEMGRILASLIARRTLCG